MRSLLTRTLSISATGRASADRVWEHYTRPALWSTWSPQITGVDCADDVIRVGSTGVVHAILGVAVPFEVTAFDDEGRQWSWVARLPLSIELELRHSVDERAGRTHTGLDVTGPIPVVLGYLPVAWLAIGRLVNLTGTR